VSAAPYPRRQQAYRLKRAAGAAAGAAAITAAGLTAGLAGLTAAAVMLLLTAGAVGLYARHWARLARRSRIGARSEDQVRQALATLDREGWRLRHSITWPGGGDIDHVAIAPTGVAFAIETKTRTYHPSQLAKVSEQAAWLRRHRRRWCPHGALPVLSCVCFALSVALLLLSDGALSSRAAHWAPAVGISALSALFWMLVVTRAWVRAAAENYADRLFGALESLTRP
jgi:hypothetical protein